MSTVVTISVASRPPSTQSSLYISQLQQQMGQELYITVIPSRIANKQLKFCYMNLNMTNPPSNCCHYNVSVGLDGYYGQKSKTTKKNYSKTPVQTRLHTCNDRCNMS